jgi:hypothetical protein
VESNENRLNLSVPEQNIASLSFCDVSETHLEHWVSGLPMANVGETARQLYHAIIELNHLIISPQNRLTLLEVIRPPIYYVCAELSKHYLNQSVTLPEKKHKIANLSQALQVHLATGYKEVIVDSLPLSKSDKVKKNLAIAGHRILSELSRTILRSCQLYCPSPQRVWMECHEVYRFAEETGLLKISVRDSQNQHKENTTIADAYKRLLMLGCCKPNQLRQNDLGLVFHLFEEWTPFVDVGQFHASSAVFVINMNKDAPPIYRSLLHSTIDDLYYGFDTSDLVHRITEHFSHDPKSHEESPLPLPVKVQDQLLAHLSQSLGILTKRTFKRIPSNGHLHICAGLSATHYFCSGEVEFSTQLIHDLVEKHQQMDDNIFLRRTKTKNDAWANAFDAEQGDGAHASTPINFNRPIYDSEEKLKKHAYRSYHVPLLNTSPGGYCLQWPNEIPGSIQAGEIVGIRESTHHNWSLAVIRWIRQVKQQGTQIGIELLAPMAEPCGVQLIQKTGAPSEYLRGLLLPELSAIGQPATLITPRLPFQTGQKVSLNQHGDETKCQLSKRVTATGSFSQFELKFFSKKAPSSGEKESTRSSSASEDDFDSLWPTL